MPLPRSVARFNKRFTNKYFVRLLGRTRGFTMVEHTGRRTGTTYQTPVYTFEGDEGHLFVSLTYGPSADWAQNVLGTDGNPGQGALDRHGQTQPITSAVVVGRSAAWPHLPRFVRLWLRVLRVHDFLQLTVSGDPSS